MNWNFLKVSQDVISQMATRGWPSFSKYQLYQSLWCHQPGEIVLISALVIILKINTLSNTALILFSQISNIPL